MQILSDALIYPGRIAVCCVLGALLLAAACERREEAPAIDARDVAHAEALAGLNFEPDERRLMLEDLGEQARAYAALRGVELANGLDPAFEFRPAAIAGLPERAAGAPQWPPVRAALPGERADLAFYGLRELGYLLRTRQISSVELTRFFLQRLKRHDPRLRAVITYTEDLALAQARRADAEIAAGRYRGPLHGIPYGVKDLFAVRGYPTTWGAEPYRDQMIDDTATVVRRLEEAGAVLVAKLSLGALAWGDVWFGGQTRNPWNTEQGASGSSAGSAAAVSAGLLPFAIGTETWGSIISPAQRTGIVGLRPSYGRVSRAGAMALAWTMDKPGPLCRRAEDCALVLDAIRGADGRDATVIEAPFAYRARQDLRGLRIGYLQADFAKDYPGRALDRASLEQLRALGAELVPLELPGLPAEALSIILSAEAAAAFDRLTRSKRDDLLVRQGRDAWPNVFRAARFIPAVEYIQAMRVRRLLVGRVSGMARGVDAWVAPATRGDNLLVTNLTGHPCIVVPNGFVAADSPHGISFCGRLYDEATIVAIAQVYQDALGLDLRPPEFRR